MPLHRLSHRMLALMAGALMLVSPTIATAQMDLPQGPVECYDADMVSLQTGGRPA